jgi:hypothetical protein
MDVYDLPTRPSAPIAGRGSRRRSVVVVADGVSTSESPARALVGALNALDIETVYVGRQDDAQRIAAIVAQKRADSVELYLARGGVGLLRELLRALIDVGRRDVSIVLHRAP